MSRIGKVPVVAPQGVQFSVQGSVLTVKGPKGSLTLPISEGIAAKVEGNQVVLTRSADTKLLRSMHGTTRALAATMVEGVTKGFSKKLEIVGVGFKAEFRDALQFTASGKTFPVVVPEGATLKFTAPARLDVSAADEAQLERVRGDLSRQLRGAHATLHLMPNAGGKKGAAHYEIIGLGAIAQGATLKQHSLELKVGFSDPQRLAIPAAVKIDIPDPNHVLVSGLDKCLVGQVAADIRATRKPEPYKGKGVRYQDETVRRKAGKAAAGATAKK